MFYFLYVALCHSGFSCGQSIFTRPIETRRIRNVQSKERKAMESEEWEPIRITMDYTQLREDYDDEYKCTEDKVGQKIIWGYENEYEVECTKDSLLTPEKINATIGTLENVKKYMESILKVKRFNGETYLHSNISNYGKIPNKTYSGVDLYISVFPRIFPNNTIAAAATTISAYDDETSRPIQGIIAVGNSFIPTEVQSLETKDQTFFALCIHELIHALGISYDDMPRWHSHENNEPYGKKYLSEIEIGGYKRIVVNSPYSHNFAVKHHGVETFKSGNQEVRSGIILEEAGENGTVLQHPDELYYFTDILNGAVLVSFTYRFCQITEVTMALLMDTGYYKVDYTKGSPLWWGSKETNKGEYIKDFITGPPQTTFPVDYILDPKRKPEFYHAGYDYSYIGYYLNTEYASLPDEVKNNLDWYNPQKSDYYGYEFTAYQLVSMPWTKCENGTAALNVVDNNAGCIKYKIGVGQVEFSSDKYGTVKCTKRGEVKLGNLTVICPDPDEFATRIALSQRTTFDSNPFDGVERYFEKSGLEAWVIALIVIGCFVVLAIISVAAFIVARHKKKDESSDEVAP